MYLEEYKNILIISNRVKSIRGILRPFPGQSCPGLHIWNSFSVSKLPLAGFLNLFSILAGKMIARQSSPQQWDAMHPAAFRGADALLDFEEKRLNLWYDEKQ